MAISKKGNETKIKDTDGQVFEIYNGDWEALKAITKSWNFKDESSALRFALAVLTMASGGKLQINGDDVNPADTLLKGHSDGEN